MYLTLLVPFNYTKKSPNTYTIILSYFSSEEQLIFESLFLFLLCWLIALELVPERKTVPKIDDSFHLCILIPQGLFISTRKPGGIFPFLPICFNLITSMTETSSLQHCGMTWESSAPLCSLILWSSVTERWMAADEWRDVFSPSSLLSAGGYRTTCN